MDPFPRGTIGLDRLAPWLAELGATAGSLGRAYVLRPPVDRRLRERTFLAVGQQFGDRWTRRVHEPWSRFVGPPADSELAAAVLDWAAGSARAGRPLDPGPLNEHLEPSEVATVRSLVAAAAVGGLAGNTVDGLLARLTGKRPLDPAAALVEALAVAVLLPLEAPWLLTAAAMAAFDRLAPPLPDVEVDDDPGLLAALIARAAPVHLGGVWSRLLVAELPVDLSIGFRAGLSSATLVVGRGRVRVRNGLPADATVLVEGETDAMVDVATGSLFSELDRLRLRRP